jgi:hypothetical protein
MNVVDFYFCTGSCMVEFPFFISYYVICLFVINLFIIYFDLSAVLIIVFILKWTDKSNQNTKIS